MFLPRSRFEPGPQRSQFNGERSPRPGARSHQFHNGPSTRRHLQVPDGRCRLNYSPELSSRLALESTVSTI
jgi:hypothetical protein